ncbi:NtaA/DmoA family FMN-dependent monooxygenase [Mycobacterium yunnanensis]|uniref:NtaA/DmoA family FMN-dependent monooxygenase n=1 Tax=Mycobacterium yunnanensis TaxID=368477 RepID=A0A9X2YWJ1_9MYCO|nr:NtaA/DmoA family FMN-dependent monooxygenase [Mycobacterium yunnanensis]MCV7419564.1 NtaA/DmoA family FMN-dependent monooxygenase [Mycobacterium yunnanensis]
MSPRLLHFNAFIWPNGYHESAWRLADDDVRNVLGLPYFADIARTAERGMLDSIFLADNVAIAEYRATHLPQVQFDPIAVLSALAASTEHIGLIGTGSTTYNEPWELARRFATLDHLSGGRAGWNIVTTVTPLAAASFGQRGHPDHADRYERAEEFVAVASQIWDSWADDAIVGDRDGGVWADRAKLRAADHHGRYFDVEGVQPFPRSPQGRPVLVLAGQSGAGVRLAARHAEMAFSGPPSLEAAVAFRTDLHAQAAAWGRNPEQVLVLPALMVTIGGTEAEARARAERLEELSSSEFRWQNALYTAGLDPDAFDPDAPLPATLWQDPSPSTRTDQLFAAARARPDASLREIARRVTGGAGQTHFVGTPEQLADHVMTWQDAGAVDGFTIMGSTLPYELTAFVDHVVPILQRRHRFRTEYTGPTLRDHLGLARPDV